ncbi:MAG TPA: ATP-binding cassette domain-containing protein [Stellaceae bacterium]|nr:ATP-binding cassette domain-containing protein [Stellaceae bacterium]
MPPSPSSSRSSISDAPLLRVRGLETRIGGRILHRQIDLDLHAGEVLAVVGASGSGKSVLLRAILGLIRPSRGTVEAFGRNLAALDAAEFQQVEARWGVLFQDGALFSSLTVAENIEVPLKQQLDLPKPLMEQIAGLKIALVGLPPDTASKYPAQLSGGMRKRAGLARALALDPALLFLDEPTAGLDPIAASEFDMLLRDLQKSLGLAVLMVTHDLDSLVALADRIAVLIDGRLKIGSLDEMLHDTDPWIKQYFSGPRGRAARPNLAMGDGD